MEDPQTDCENEPATHIFNCEDGRHLTLKVVNVTGDRPPEHTYENPYKKIAPHEIISSFEKREEEIWRFED